MAATATHLRHYGQIRFTLPSTSPKGHAVNASRMVPLVLAALSLFAPGVRADIKTWQTGGTDFWSTPTNWSPAGEPGGNDEAVVDVARFVFLDRGTLPIEGLSLSQGAVLVTNGFQLWVRDSGRAVTQVSGTNTIIIAPPHANGVPAIETDVLRISSDALLSMSGSIVRVRDNLQTSGGRIQGHGRLEVLSNLEGRILRTGLIRPEGGTLELRAPGRATFDLGAGGAGDIDIAGNTMLQIDADCLDFDGTLDIADEGTFFALRPWTVGANGLVTLTGGEMSGNVFGNRGTIRGAGSVVADTFVNEGRLAPSDGTLVVAADAVDLGGPSSNGLHEAIDGNLEIRTAPGPVAVSGTIAAGAGRVCRFPGLELQLANSARVNLSGGRVECQAFESPAAGAAMVTVFAGPESQIVAPGSSELGGVVLLFGDLRFSGGDVLVPASANFAGPGTLVVDFEMEAHIEDDAAIAVALRNEGFVHPGTGGGPGRVRFLTGYEQSATGALHVDIEGTADGAFDRLDVTGTATLDGTLRIDLQNHVPQPGDTYEIIRASAVTGQFEQIDSDDGFEIDYHPDRVVARYRGTVCPADLDGDGDVGFGDLVILLGGWGQNAGHPGDLDGNGFVDFNDLVILLAAWGGCD